MVTEASPMVSNRNLDKSKVMYAAMAFKKNISKVVPILNGLLAFDPP